MSFREFVQNLRPAGLPLGTFLQDAQRDPNLPEVRSWEELRLYLIGSQATQETIRTAFYFWKDYEALGNNRRHLVTPRR